MMTSFVALLWAQKLIAIAIIFQTLELGLIRETYSDRGVWRWETLKEEFRIFSKFHQSILNFTLNYNSFCILLIIRLVLAFLLLFFSSPIILSLLLVSTILISLRWRGTFNGGSDYVTVLMLYSLTFASFANSSETIENAVLWYITLQIISSYFISGIVKLKNNNWRTGKALKGFLASTIYQDSKLTNYVREKKVLLVVISWAVMLFEVFFVTALLSPQVCLVFLSFALLFHLANYYFFGLNRFFFSWLSCYPAIYYCSSLT